MNMYIMQQLHIAKGNMLLCKGNIYIYSFLFLYFVRWYIGVCNCYTQTYKGNYIYNFCLYIVRSYTKR